MSVCLKESLNLLGHGIGREMEIIGNFDAENLSAAINSEHLQSLILNLGFNSRDALGRPRPDRSRFAAGLPVGRRYAAKSDSPNRESMQEISFADDGRN